MSPEDVIDDFAPLRVVHLGHGPLREPDDARVKVSHEVGDVGVEGVRADAGDPNPVDLVELESEREYW